VTFGSRRSSLELSAGSASRLPRYAADIVDEHHCTDDQLCERCYGQAVRAKDHQAGVIGQCWAERVCRGEFRAQAGWPENDPKTVAIARRLVRALARDPRLLDALARACTAGAAAWWRSRPAGYRVEHSAARAIWALETDEHEHERCMVVEGGERCPRAPEWLVRSEDAAWDDYAYVCDPHRELVAAPGHTVTSVEQGKGETA